MTLKVEVEEGATRWPEIMAEVEAGRDVVIARGAVPVATVRGQASLDRTSQEAIDAIFEIRKAIPPTTVEEILAWRDEGRRY